MNIIGHEDAKATFVDAFSQNRLHHGWIIQGPSGIGKRTLANYFANHLLGNNANTQTEIESGAHKDLCILARDPDSKKRDIPLEDVHKLRAFFHHKSALGGWRVGIIDSLDELNRNGLNALLKTLEEPPAKCALLLISHGRMSLLPTIISRCQILHLSPLSGEDTQTVLKEKGLPQDLSNIADGRPGLAMMLTQAEARAAYDAAQNLFERSKASADQKAQALRLAGKSEVAFNGFVQGFLSRLAKLAESKPDFAQVWLDVSRLYADSLEDALDRNQTTARILSCLK